MGWDVYDVSYSKDRVLADLDSGWGDSFTMLAKRLVGLNYWQVLEVSKNGKKHRFISLALLEKPIPKDGMGWAVKVMDEASYPYYFDCPLSFIDLAGPSDHVEVNNWRREVASFHEKKKGMDKIMAGLSAGESITFDGKDYVLVEPYKRSEWIVFSQKDQRRYRIRNSYIRDAISEAAERDERKRIEDSVVKPNASVPLGVFSQGSLFA